MTTTTLATITVLAPDIYKDFGCVGGACRSNCCRFNWQIFVDKPTYKKLRNMREPSWLADDFGRYFGRNPASEDASDYAMLKQGSNGACQLQLPNGLCRIHAELGESYLSTTCKTYPRHHTVLIGSKVDERGICSSCEEVARLLLAHPEPIQMVQHTEQVARNSLKASMRDATGLISLDKNAMNGQYLAIRAVLVGLLQAREYGFNERMMLVCLLLDKLSQLEESGHAETVLEELEKFVEAVNSGVYDALLQKSFGVDAARVFTEYSWSYALVTALTAGDSVVQQCTAGLLKEDYSTRTERYNAFLAGERGHIVEHILVTELWNKGIPFKEGYSIRQNLYYLVTTYAVLRCFLAGSLVAKPEPSDTELVDWMAVFGKRVLHSKINFTSNIELLQKNDMTTLPYLLAIIKG